MKHSNTVTRRSLLATAGSALLVPSLSGAALELSSTKFRIVHMTDIHIQPELGAPDGVSRCVEKILALHPRPDFVLTGGDHVMDLLNVDRARADVQFGLLAERLKPLEMPIRHCVGNHDVYGWAKGSSVSESDPEYGKAMYQERVREGKTYYSFDHKGWHFIVLDTIGLKGRQWMGHVDDAQLQWLKDDLAATPEHTPVLVNLHMPIVTAFVMETASPLLPATPALVTSNGQEVFKLLRTRSVKLVLQGHTHILETIDYAGTRFMTAGAVCGDWWKGWRLGIHPEGFTVLDFDGDNVSAKYTPYGWKAVST